MRMIDDVLAEGGTYGADETSADHPQTDGLKKNPSAFEDDQD
jgi:hypothetical protein